ncbi:hypothetical protein HY389_00650 [Candidatus Daviesbacteria bacterium]|nr:hypothetical protein [Candidatus Daviesbacteria bacterium]
MKYDGALSQVQGLIPTTKNVLIALPSQVNVDQLAAGLALKLSLEQSQREATVVTDGVIRVGHSNLFGVGDVQNQLAQGGGGSLVITLGGVADPQTNTVPALEKLDWNTSGNDLNLVFHVLPGQTFQPAFVTPKYQGGGYDLIFVIGAQTLPSLGTIYTSNQSIFSGAHIINIDTNGQNTQFGTTNLVDPSASSVSEIVAQILPSLGFAFEGDVASNILSGIYEATKNLQGPNVGADTFLVVAEAVKQGGQRPVQTQPQAAPIGLQPVMPQAAPQREPQQMPDLSAIFGTPLPIQPQMTSPGPVENFTVPPVVTENQSENQPSPEEAPSGEGVRSVTPEPDWLTPKVFKGSSIG